MGYAQKMDRSLIRCLLLELLMLDTQEMLHQIFSTVPGDYGTEEEYPTPDESEPGVEVPSMSLKHSILHCVTLIHCKSAVTMVFLYLYKQYKVYHIQNNKLPYIPRHGLMITYQSLSIGNYSTQLLTTEELCTLIVLYCCFMFECCLGYI